MTSNTARHWKKEGKIELPDAHRIWHDSARQSEKKVKAMMREGIKKGLPPRR